MTKQHIFIIENNLQKVGESFFHLSRWTTVIQDLLNRRQFSLVADNQTKINVEAWRCRKIWQYIKLFSTTIFIKKNLHKKINMEICFIKWIILNVCICTCMHVLFQRIQHLPFFKKEMKWKLWNFHTLVTDKHFGVWW